MNHQTIQLNGLRFYAYHGVEPQERTVGTYYNIDIEVIADIYKSLISDSINDTVNYAEIAAIVGDIMKQPSNLLEHIAGMITDKLFRSFSMITEISIRICKENPPIGVSCREACVTLHRHR